MGIKPLNSRDMLNQMFQQVNKAQLLESKIQQYLSTTKVCQLKA